MHSSIAVAIIAASLSCLSISCAYADASPEVFRETISFQSHGVALSGIVTTPSNPRAGVVVINGAGREDQLLMLATYMAAHDIAVLTYDKRGIGRSGGVYEGPEAGTNNVTPANLALLADDAAAALKTLLDRPGLRNLPAGFFGFSQAGWIAPPAARSNRSARFLVLISAPVVTTREQMRFQFFTGGNTAFWKTHSEKDVREHIRTAPDPFPFDDTDPRSALAELSIPGLWLFGDNDVLVPVLLSRERLAELASQGKSFESRLYEGGDHMLLISKPAALDDAIAWIRQLKHQADTRPPGQQLPTE